MGGGGGGGIKRWSASVSVCLMSRTSALTRKAKGLGRRNFAQGYPRSHATPTPTSRSKGQKSGWGGGILWRPPSRTACLINEYTCVIVCSTWWMSIQLTGRETCAACLYWLPNLCRTGCACTHQETRAKQLTLLRLPSVCLEGWAYTGRSHWSRFFFQLLNFFSNFCIKSVTGFALNVRDFRFLFIRVSCTT